MNDSEQLAQVARARRVASGLLLVMSALFFLTDHIAGHSQLASFVTAFAEAAMVGALADWFAVTALFRHPLGLPIPHTAIIPRNKDRLADSIADFLEHNFMTREVLSDELGQIDFAGLAVSWLSDTRHSRWLALRLLRVVPPSLQIVDDVQIRVWLKKSLQTGSARVKLGPIAAEVLSVLVADQKHQALFDRMILWAHDKLEQYQPLIRERVYRKTPRWMPRMIDEHLALRLIEEFADLLNEMAVPDSSWRTQFNAEIDKLIDDLRSVPEMEQKLHVIIGQTLQHPLLLQYLDRLGREIRQRMAQDLAAPSSGLQMLMADMLIALAQALGRDVALQRRINHGLQELGANAIARQRKDIVGLIRRVVRKWDAYTVSRKMELYVGRDLQYIRINGTLVGGLVGILLHGLQLLIVKSSYGL